MLQSLFGLNPLRSKVFKATDLASMIFQEHHGSAMKKTGGEYFFVFSIKSWAVFHPFVGGLISLDPKQNSDVLSSLDLGDFFLKNMDRLVFPPQGSLTPSARTADSDGAVPATTGVSRSRREHAHSWRPVPTTALVAVHGWPDFWKLFDRNFWEKME